MGQSRRVLQDYVATNGLFLPSSLKKQFLEITPIIMGTIIAAETSHEYKDYKMRGAARDDLQTKGEPIFKAIETAIEQRLHSHARNDKSSL